MPTPYADGEFHTRNVKAVRRGREEGDRRQARDRRARQRLADQAPGHPARGVDRPGEHRASSCSASSATRTRCSPPTTCPSSPPATTTRGSSTRRRSRCSRRSSQGRGLRLLYSVAWPGQGIYTKEPLKSVADLKGTKFRTYSPLTARLAELLGASPTVIQVPEIPQMFATGAVQAMITSSATGTSTKAWEFVKNYYKTSAFHPKNVVVVNAARLRAPAEGPAGARSSRPPPRPRSAAGTCPRRARRKANETLAKNGMTRARARRRDEGRVRQDRRADGAGVGEVRRRRRPGDPQALTAASRS